MIDIEVEDPAWTAALTEAEQLVRTAAQAALNATSRSPSGGAPAEPVRGLREEASGASTPSGPSDHLPLTGEGLGVTLLLTDDETVRGLNARFRGKDAATNVLSFPAPHNPEKHLGDVALAFGVCAREAQAQGKPLAHHLQHLTVHGVLHLLGYDHMSEDEAEAMEGLERAILGGLGVPDPYAAGEGDDERP